MLNPSNGQTPINFQLQPVNLQTDKLSSRQLSSRHPSSRQPSSLTTFKPTRFERSTTVNSGSPTFKSTTFKPTRFERSTTVNSGTRFERSTTVNSGFNPSNSKPTTFKSTTFKSTTFKPTSFKPRSFERSTTVNSRSADETSTHDAGATEHPSGPSEQGTSNPVNNGSKAKNRMRLDPAVFDTMKHLPCDQLRKKIVAHARYKRLVAEDRVALEAAYNRFQTEVHLIALERLLKLDPVWKHIGDRARFRGPTNYNNFCEYDIEARKVYYDDNIPVRQRKKECGRLWRLLDKATKLKYKDIDFLAQLPNPFGRGDCPGPDGGTSQASRKKARRSRFFREAETELWSRKVMLDLKNLGAAHDVEGFVMLYKSKGTTSEVVSGGSIMGEQFVDMCAKEKTSDIAANFLSFASGQELIKRMTGSTSKVVKPRKRQRRLGTSASAYDKGSKEKNLEAARGKLNEAISKVTHSAKTEWPGKTTANTLKKLGVTLRIKDNEHGITVNTLCGKVGPKQNDQLKLILRAFEDDLVVLTGPPAPDAPATVGADPDEATNNEPRTSRELTGRSKRTAKNGGSKEGEGSADVAPAKKKRSTHTNTNSKKRKRPRDDSDSSDENGTGDDAQHDSEEEDEEDIDDDDDDGDDDDDDDDNNDDDDDEDDDIDDEDED
ncbi:uncharacterized protein PGTG_03286 [Puccinia graminis f. sp. tritici CRL 75-36-700-3]|uniref:Uncharacterized protein n=1 Tax=Puccinia graminis f. sp. tritici (strain CRL 75-36-700-3 / race SCCL) TaxID=418459 RepID=E3JZ55_PUCGT|nr:uncharacterized protein PGTG_03286 [Puccinia graminis f. sp. tritici CRL 75-36-700-3]EFP77330.1 hypothetical protein PGTG_03286 [Puccinia graminis f. sp. tritici CRL 75-36-700-3]